MVKDKNFDRQVRIITGYYIVIVRQETRILCLFLPRDYKLYITGLAKLDPGGYMSTSEQRKKNEKKKNTHSFFIVN